MSMPTWKLNIFVNAIRTRYKAGEGTYEEIIATYPKLTAEEKAAILAVLEPKQ
jgi:uncharacterized protein (DUF433 family)